jgi:hypothetical protein
MKKTVTLDYYVKIKSILPSHKFQKIENLLNYESNLRLEAFWHIIVAGYTVDFAIKNYEKLYEFLKDKPITYSQALITYVIYPGLHSGIHIKKTRWFELN